LVIVAFAKPKKQFIAMDVHSCCNNKWKPSFVSNSSPAEVRPEDAAYVQLFRSDFAEARTVAHQVRPDVAYILVDRVTLVLRQLAVTNPNGSMIGGWSLSPDHLRIGFTRLCSLRGCSFLELQSLSASNDSRSGVLCCSSESSSANESEVMIADGSTGCTTHSQ
jgi:hypothetical protein